MLFRRAPPGNSYSRDDACILRGARLVGKSAEVWVRAAVLAATGTWGCSAPSHGTSATGTITVARWSALRPARTAHGGRRRRRARHRNSEPSRISWG